MLRKLQKCDFKELEKRLNELSDEDKKLYHPHPFTKEALEQLINFDYDFYFVKILKGKIVGYSMLRTFGKYAVPTYGQVIWEEFRGTGLGSQILEETINEAKNLGFGIIKLKVYEHNYVAHNLYKKHGFKKIGTEGKEIWMQLDLF